MKRKRSCEEIRAILLAYRSGEVSPLQRQRVEQHVATCGVCRADLDLAAAIERAGREPPPPLSDARKRAILGEIHQRIAAEERSLLSRLWPRGRGLLLPAGGLAVVATALLFILRTPAPLPDRSGWLQGVSGVEAFVPDPAPVALSRTEAGPRLRLDARAVLVRFHRLEGQPPLHVETPHGEAIIRGTVFFVEALDEATVVGVQEGTVEVHGGRGESALVGPGEQATLDDQGARLEAGRSPRFAALRALFPPAPAPDAAPAPPPHRPRPPKVRPTQAPAPDPMVIARVVGRALPRFRGCYERGLKNHPDLEGRMVAELTYGADGRIVEGHTLEDGLHVPAVTDCLHDVLLDLTFPPGTGEVTVQVPLVFTPSGVRQGR
jgi:hypothetical protein